MSKIDLSEFVQYGRLFEVYGKLLSTDRQKIMISYFEYNMTLVEIAQERKISRQAVLDAIDKSCQKLKDYESSLQFVAKREDFVKDLKELATTEDQSVKEKVDKILRKL